MSYSRRRKHHVPHLTHQEAPHVVQMMVTNGFRLLVISLLGSNDGSELGSLLGSDDGSLLGSDDGSELGSLLGSDDNDGSALGSDDGS